MNNNNLLYTKFHKHWIFLFLVFSFCGVRAQVGTIDTSFAPNLQFGSFTSSVIDNSDVIVGGGLIISGQTYNLAKFDTNGNLVSAFPLRKVYHNGSIGVITSLCKLSNGTIMVAGSFNNYDGISTFSNGNPILGLICIDANGNLVNSFAPNLSSILGGPYVDASKILSDSSNNIYVPIDMPGQVKIMKISSSGVVDTAFLNNGTSICGTIRDMEFQNLGSNAGKIVIVGQISSDCQVIAGNYLGILRINTNGAIDATFNALNNGIYTSQIDYITEAEIDTVEIFNDDAIFIGGFFPSYNGTVTNNYAKLTTNGLIFPGFNSNTAFTPSYNASYILSSKITLTGKILLGNISSNYLPSNYSNKLYQLNTDGTIDQCFLQGDSSSFLNTLSVFWSINQYSNGKILVAGDFSRYDTAMGISTIPGVVRLNNSVSLVAKDDTFNFGCTTSASTSTAFVFTNDKLNDVFLTSLSGFTINQVGTPVAGITVNPDGTITVASGVTSGTYTLQYNLSNACVTSNTATITVIVNSTFITPTFTQVPAICSGATLAPLPTTSTNGITGTWSPALNNTATTIYTFTPTSGSCASTKTMTITVNPNVVPTFNQVATICSGATLAALPTTSTNGVTGTWLPALNNTATTTYTFTPTVGSCASTKTMTITITVNPNVVPTFNQVAAICSGATLAALPTTSTNGVTGTWSPALNNAATTTYTFTPTAGLCATTKTMTITINPKVVPVFNQLAAICYGATLAALPTTSTNGVSGTWSPALNNTATTTYTFTPTAGLCATTTTMTISVNPITPILAVNDDFTNTPISFYVGGQTASILSNDTLNGLQANSSNVTITIVSTNPPVTTLPTVNSSGNITLLPNMPIGNFTINYKISKVGGCPGNFSTASVALFIDQTTPNLNFGIRANSDVKKVLLQSDGKIIIQGAFTKYNNIDAHAIARLYPDLTLDQTFHSPDLSGSRGAGILDMVIDSNDRIILVGSATNLKGFNGTYGGKGIIRLKPNGDVDPTFTPTKLSLSNGAEAFAYSVALDNYGRILVGGGFFDTCNGIAVPNMIRLPQNGGDADGAFNFQYGLFNSTSPQLSLTSVITKILVLNDDTIIVGGLTGPNYTSPGNYLTVQPNLFRLSSNGSLMNVNYTASLGAINYYGTPNNNCYSCYTPIQNIVKIGNSNLAVVGSFDNYKYQNTLVSNTKNFVIVDYNLNPTKFLSSAITPNRVIKDVEVSGTNNLYISGEFTALGATSSNRLAKLVMPVSGNSLTLDSSFGIGSGTALSISPLDNSVNSLKMQSDGKLILGGYFDSYNGISATNITRIRPTIVADQSKETNILWESEEEIDINKTSILGDDKINFYPNPSNGIFNIDLSNTKEKFTRITVYNILGEEVFKNDITPETNNEINLSMFPSGYYIARIFNSEKSIQIKLIKQ